MNHCAQLFFATSILILLKFPPQQIWRISTEILHHHPNSKMEDYNNIYERMKHSGVKHYLMVRSPVDPDCPDILHTAETHLRHVLCTPQISLEHSFHLLLHGHIEDSKRQLSIAESWRYGKESAAQHQSTRLIQAYRSLLDYIIWCDKKFTHSNTGKMIHSLTPFSFIIYLLVLHRLLFDVTVPSTDQRQKQPIFQSNNVV